MKTIDNILNWLRRMSPNALLVLLLSLWTLLNVMQAAFSELSGDEAYYWSWVSMPGAGLDWGYYDHPPMVALLIWLTSWMGGTLGVRLAAVLLQPLYLWLLWLLVRPVSPTRRQALLFAAVCFAVPALQLYGFLVLPDAPLLFFSILFLYIYRLILQRPTALRAVALGIVMALLAYSKYHGALVVGFALLSNPRLLRRWHIYAALVVALLLYVPHLLWQADHGWCSFLYHLMGRHKGFLIENPPMVILNLVLIANPLLAWHYCKALFCSTNRLLGAEAERHDAQREFVRTLRWIAYGVTGFFFLAAFRGYTQAQWLLPAVVALVAMLCLYLCRHAAAERYVFVVAAIAAVLFLAVRVVVMIGPSWLRLDLTNAEHSNRQMIELTQRRPIVLNGYSRAARYAYYTAAPVACVRMYDIHDSQWNMRNDDQAFYGKECIVEVPLFQPADTLVLADGHRFRYQVNPFYRPLTKVRIAIADTLAAHTITASLFELPLAIHNPYPFALSSDEADSLRLNAFVVVSKRIQPLCQSAASFTLPPEATTVVECQFALPDSIANGTYDLGFCITPRCGLVPRLSDYYSISINRKATQ